MGDRRRFLDWDETTVQMLPEDMATQTWHLPAGDVCGWAEDDVLHVTWVRPAVLDDLVTLATQLADAGFARVAAYSPDQPRAPAGSPGGGEWTGGGGSWSVQPAREVVGPIPGATRANATYAAVKLSDGTVYTQSYRTRWGSSSHYEVLRSVFNDGYAPADVAGFGVLTTAGFDNTRGIQSADFYAGVLRRAWRDHQQAGESVGLYDPNQPRDDQGRWTGGGGGDSPLPSDAWMRGLVYAPVAGSVVGPTSSQTPLRAVRLQDGTVYTRGAFREEPESEFWRAQGAPSHYNVLRKVFRDGYTPADVRDVGWHQAGRGFAPDAGGFYREIAAAAWRDHQAEAQWGRHYAPDQPRDEQGRWTEGGGSTAAPAAAAASLGAARREAGDWFVRDLSVGGRVVGVMQYEQHGTGLYVHWIGSRRHGAPLELGHHAMVAVARQLAHEGVTTITGFRVGGTHGERSLGEDVTVDISRLATHYSPDQPRDDQGRWTSGGGGAPTSAGTPSGETVAGQTNVDLVQSRRLARSVGTKNGECWKNSALALAGAPTGSRYVEGYAIPRGTIKVPFQHGWIETPDGKIIDTTPVWQGRGTTYFAAQKWTMSQLGAAVSRRGGGVLPLDRAYRMDMVPPAYVPAYKAAWTKAIGAKGAELLFKNIRPIPAAHAAADVRSALTVLQTQLTLAFGAAASALLLRGVTEAQVAELVERPSELSAADLEQFAMQYNPDQPRAPAGSPEGGEWTSGGGGGEFAPGGAGVGHVHLSASYPTSAGPDPWHQRDIINPNGGYGGGFLFKRRGAELHVLRFEATAMAGLGVHQVLDVLATLRSEGITHVYGHSWGGGRREPYPVDIRLRPHPSPAVHWGAEFLDPPPARAPHPGFVWRSGAEFARLLERGLRAETATQYNPDQPRVPAGSPEGGEWGGGGRGGAAMAGRTFGSKETADAWGAGTQQWAGTLTAQQAAALDAYTVIVGVNDTLRAGRAPNAVDPYSGRQGASLTEADVVAGLDSLLAQPTAALSEDVITYRAWAGRTLQKRDVGDEFIDRGFLSTALHAPEIAMFHVDPNTGRALGVDVKIRVPAGTKALYLGVLPPGPRGARPRWYADSTELLLNRGLHYRVVATDKTSQRWARHVTVEVVP